MKAWVLHGIGDLRFEDVPVPEPQDDEVIVKVKAAGICSSDIARVYSSGAYHYPIILGHEFSGIAPDGTRVGVFPLLPCHICGSCMARQYETCSSYGYLGSRQDGAFAEYVAVKKWNLVALPDEMTFEQAALLEPAAVALHAVKRAGLGGVTSAGVIGDGVIGRLIAKWLSILCDADVSVLGRGSVTPNEKCDVCFEAAGSADALRRCIELAKPNGQVVLVGNPGVDFVIDQMLHWQILRKQLSVTGSWNSSYPEDWNETLNNAGALRLEGFIGVRYKLDELGGAFENVRGKGKGRGKAVVVFD